MVDEDDNNNEASAIDDEDNKYGYCADNADVESDDDKEDDGE
jgi:hypothetical protein